jgi:AraC family transcriptional regulator, transcriptional activator of the genes for pyochelin and ferripyochelin receptors
MDGRVEEQRMSSQMPEVFERFSVTELGGMRVFGGSTVGRAGTSWTSELSPGMTVCVMLRGAVQCSFESTGARQSDLVEWNNLMFGTIRTRSPVEMSHNLQHDTNLAGVFVHFEPDELTRIIGDEAEKLLERALAPFDIACPASCPRRIQSLAWQMIGCPLRGASRRLYLSGKALELLAFALDDMGENCESCPLVRDIALSPGDIERLHAARTILVSELADPPTLQQLASRVGINVNKLKSGFNQLFESSVYAFVKGKRLDEARLLLESGEASVTEVARQLGYHAASFATAFRQRFGISPSAYLASKRRQKAAL